MNSGDVFPKSVTVTQTCWQAQRPTIVHISDMDLCAACYCGIGEPHKPYCPWSGTLGVDSIRKDVGPFHYRDFVSKNEPWPIAHPEETDQEVFDAADGAVSMEDMAYAYAAKGMEEYIKLQRCREEEKEISPFDTKLKKAGEEITSLVREKNIAYGNSVNKTISQLNSLFPDGIRPAQYRDLLLMIRVLDKFNRLSNGDPKAFGENPWRDIAGYGIIGMAQGDGGE